MKDVLKRTTYAGVGLYDKMKEGLDELIERGQRRQQDGKGLKEADPHAHPRVHELKGRIETGVRRAVDRLPPVQFKRELHELEAHVEDLERRVLRLEQPDLAETESLSGI